MRGALDRRAIENSMFEAEYATVLDRRLLGSFCIHRREQRWEIDHSKTKMNGASRMICDCKPCAVSEGASCLVITFVRA
jgi:hypothetical protein